MRTANGRLILGLSAYYHDSAAALIRDGEIVAAAQEERFTRRKFDAAFPRQAIAYCLREAGARLEQVDEIVFYEKPFEKFDRILQNHLSHAPRGFGAFRRALPVWLKEKLFLKSTLAATLADMCSDPGPGTRAEMRQRLRFSWHHLSHAASAFYPSPFQDAAVLTLDGVGEWATASLHIGRGKELKLAREIHFPHSLGLLYSAFTAYCGFKVNSGEYKLMGLAPYGEPKYADVIRRELVRIADDGSFELNMKYFGYETGDRMTNSAFHKLFGGQTRDAEGPLLERHMDLAASIQAVTEEIMLKLTREVAASTGARHLCLAGGVALNCVANGKILRDGRFDGIWIQPASGDAGGALGAALALHYLKPESRRVPREQDSMHGAFLGPAYTDAQIEAELKQAGAIFHRLSETQLLARSADLLAAGKALAWFQGRMEFGPRSLGSRSILADARSSEMQTLLNLKIKFRESFRPFAPAVLREDVADWFELDSDSPYMLLVADVRSTHRQVGDAAGQGFARLKNRRTAIPAVTHVDGSARVQTVHRETNPLFHALISEFKARTGCPVIVNTSFNVRGEPIVNTPTDAWRCLMGTDLDALAIGGYLLLKEEQPIALLNPYHQQLEKD